MIQDLVARRLVAGPAADGTFASGEITRLRLIRALLSSGVGLEELAEAVAAGRLSFDFASEVIADPPGLTTRDQRQALASIGLDEAFARRLQLAIGLPQGDPDRPIREDDLELYTLVAAGRSEGLSEETLLAVLRSFGVAIRSIVGAQRDLFRQAVEEPLLASGASRGQVLEQTAQSRLRLQRMGYRVVFLLLRRMLEEAVFENVILRLEEALEEAAVGRVGDAGTSTIAFADLSGFTQLTLQLGDAAAAEHSSRFIALVQDVTTTFGGRLVKPLGDGVMLHFKRPGEAIECLAALILSAGKAGLPALRAGVAVGPVVSRDGDFFGHTVNLAARLSAAAAPSEIWATPAVAAAATAVTFAERPPPKLKGIDDVGVIHAARITVA